MLNWPFAGRIDEVRVRRIGVVSRFLPCTSSGKPVATFMQILPAVIGFTELPRTREIAPSSTCTLKLQVSPQSSGHTLGKLSGDALKTILRPGQT